MEWPSDVDTRHIGALGLPLEDLLGVWIRAVPGNFVWGEIEPVKGRYLWIETHRWVCKCQKERLVTLVMVWPFVAWDQNTCNVEKLAVVDPRKGMVDRLYGFCDSLAYAFWLSSGLNGIAVTALIYCPGSFDPLPTSHWCVSSTDR